MTGLYIHIPFCKSRCIYCAFYSTTAEQMKQAYVDAVCREMELRKAVYEKEGKDVGKTLATVYLGGGTPSQLSPTQLQQLFDTIARHYDMSDDAEITIECNPDDVTEAFAELLRSLPVNRVSMGAQTFDDDRLQFIHRRHTSEQVTTAIQRLREKGIHNISIDLMYGFPEETLEEWEYDIQQALALNVEHISAYALTYEEGTPLYRLLEEGKVKEIDEERSLAMYDRLIDRLQEAGYEHYEISNFSRKGWRSRHNSSYWQLVPYIGIGAAAHSYDGRRRQWNIADINSYINHIQQGIVPAEGELLDKDSRYNDHVMLALRTCEGLDLSTLDSDERSYCEETAKKFVLDGLLVKTDNHLRLSRKGLFVSDMIMSELMKA